jgi:uncharacterized protein (TIGR02118 family)
MLKVITLMKRRPGLSVEDFHSHWYGIHGPLLRRAPGIRRYVQSHTLVQGYRKGELLFDGISELLFDDDDAFAVFKASDAFQMASADLATFVDPGRLVEMPVDVHVIKNGAIPPNAVKNIEFVNRRPGMDLEDFRAYWRNVHGPIAAKIPVLHRYEQNHLKQTAYTACEPPYDGLAITWFASTAHMKRGTTTPEYQATRADEPNFLAEGHLPLIVTREHVMLE